MKILVIGLDYAEPEILFGDKRLGNIRRLMGIGCFGRLVYAVPSDKLGIWMSLAASQNLGSLEEAGTEGQETVQSAAMWKQLEDQGKGVIVVGKPPLISYPSGIGARVNSMLLDAKLMEVHFADRKADLFKDRIYALSRNQFDLVRILMQSQDWDYLHFVDDGLYQLGAGGLFNPEGYRQDMLTDYYLYLDEQLGTVLDLLDDNTIVLVVSPRGNSPQEGGFILASSNNPLEGELEDVHLLDIAPTVLELGGYEVPASMQGKSLVGGKIVASDVDLSAEEEEILRERLSGLGYF